MKSSILVLSLAFSASVFAKTPATTALNNIIDNGNYHGNTGRASCEVSVATSNDSASVTIKTNEATELFVLVNSSLSYNVNNVTGEISATQNLNFPHYINGGKKILNVKPVSSTEVNFSISTILLDHRGNDASSFVECNLNF